MKFKTLLCFFLFSGNFLSAQFFCTDPDIAPILRDEPPGCFLCGSNLQGNTAGFSSDIAVYDFPCGTIENSQWIAIKADSSSTLVAVISPSLCTARRGIEAAIYDSQLNLVSNCITALNDSSVSLIATGLTPGENYSILIDGKNGDNCSFFIKFTGFEYPFPTLINTSPRLIPAFDGIQLCSEGKNCFSIPAVLGTTSYKWQIPFDGIVLSGGTKKDTFICLRFSGFGAGGVISVTPSNYCFEAIPSQYTTIVTSDVISNGQLETVCIEDFPITKFGFTVDTFGIFTDTTYDDITECNIVKILAVEPINPAFNIDTLACPGDCIMVDDSCYVQTTDRSIFLTCQEIPELNITFSDTGLFQINCFLDSFTNALAFDWNVVGADSFQIWLNNKPEPIQAHSSFLLPVDSTLGDSIKFSVQGSNFLGCPFRKTDIFCPVPKITSVRKKHFFEKVKIYPNPTSGIFEIESEMPIEKVSIFDLSGKLVLEKFDKKIDLANYKSGVYFLKINVQGKIHFRKIVKF